MCSFRTKSSVARLVNPKLSASKQIAANLVIISTSLDFPIMILSYGPVLPFEIINSHPSITLKGRNFDFAPTTGHSLICQLEKTITKLRFRCHVLIGLRVSGAHWLSDSQKDTPKSVLLEINTLHHLTNSSLVVFLLCMYIYQSHRYPFKTTQWTRSVRPLLWNVDCGQRFYQPSLLVLSTPPITVKDCEL